MIIYQIKSYLYLCLKIFITVWESFFKVCNEEFYTFKTSIILLYL